MPGMNLLIINPALVRLTSLGACEQDRLAHVARLRERGHRVHLLTGYTPYQDPAAVRAFYAERDLPLADLVPVGGQARHPARLRQFAYADGMAWEYAAPGFTAALIAALDRLKPDAIWCHGSYLWRPAQIARQRGLPTVIRSVNYEPEQLRHENAPTIANRVRYAAKVHGEQHAAHAAVIAAISPAEQAIYARLTGDPDRAVLLPLQTLPAVLSAPRSQTERRPLNAFFMGASYNVAHNRAALRWLLTDVIPLVRDQMPGLYRFHLLGSKVPPELAAHAADDVADDVIFPGYVPDLAALLAEMHVALAPSLGGVGMQQKVFEPLARAFPTLTHNRALAGYPFTAGTHLLTAETAPDWASALAMLSNPRWRERLSHAAAEQAAALFSRAALDHAVDAALTAADRHARR